MSRCKRAMMPNGGWRMVETGHQGGRQGARPRRSRRSSPSTARPTTTRVFGVYTKQHQASPAHNKILTGLPDAYGRGRIIGDYRRVALYGVNTLIEFKQRDKDSVPYRNDFTEPEIEHWIRFREEHDEQIKALKKLMNLGNEYGLDLSRPATDRAGGRAVDLHGLPRLRQEPGRRRHVLRPRLRLLRLSTSSAT